MSALRITVYDAAGGDLADGAVRFVYCRDGAVTVEKAGEAHRLWADEGAFAAGATRIRGEGSAWIYEIAPRSAPYAGDATLILSHAIAPAFGPPWLVRADRIESPPGAVTPRHGHRGPGLRRLVYGTLLAEVGDAVERIGAGGAWYETGNDPVVGTNIGGTNAAFVRVMVLPVELEGGKSSFVPADEAEAAKPRAVSNRLFGELRVSGDLSAVRRSG